MKISGIYKIESKLKPERIYIGSAINIQNRWHVHLCQLRANKHYSKKLQRHYNKYSESDLQFSILSGCDKEDLIRQEQFYIDAVNPYFNNRNIAESNRGYKWNEESKNKLSLNRKGIPHTEETKYKMRLAHFGKKYKPMSEEGRINIRNARRGKKLTEEHRAKLRGRKSGHKGIPLSEETKEKIRNTLKGKLPYRQSIPEDIVPLIIDAIKKRGEKTLKQISIDYNISYYIIRDISCGKSYKRENKVA